MHHLGEPVESLRIALRPRGGQEASESSTDGLSATGASLPSTHDPSADGEGTEPDELLTRARRFADAVDAVGIVGVVHSEPQSSAGLRIETLADGDAEHPARHRA